MILPPNRAHDGYTTQPLPGMCSHAGLRKGYPPPLPVFLLQCFLPLSFLFPVISAVFLFFFLSENSCWRNFQFWNQKWPPPFLHQRGPSPSFPEGGKRGLKETISSYYLPKVMYFTSPHILLSPLYSYTCTRGPCTLCPFIYTIIAILLVFPSASDYTKLQGK